jgi:mannose-6-phosphate isomerase
MNQPEHPIAAPMALACLPQTVERPWGGTRLAGRGNAWSAPRIGESWETSGLQGHVTRFRDGRWADLAAMLADPSDPLRLRGGAFPLLFKLIDAAENLSIQVHPAEATCDGAAKTEAWIVLEATEGAFLYAGVREELGREDLVARVASGDLSLLDRIEVRAGDVVLIPGGTIHAITAGLLVAEIQQSSDTTWRIWDWDRRDAHGATRTLHVAQATRDVDPVPRPGLRIVPLPDGLGGEFLVACPCFVARRHRSPQRIEARSGWTLLFQAGKTGRMDRGIGLEPFEFGQTLLLPHGASVRIEGEVLEFWVADLQAEVMEPLLACGHSEASIRALGAGTW